MDGGAIANIRHHFLFSLGTQYDFGLHSANGQGAYGAATDLMPSPGSEQLIANGSVASETLATGTPLVTDLSYGQIAGPIQVPPGDYDLGIFPAGAGGTPVASTHTPVLEPGQEYLAIASGFLAPNAGEAAFDVLYFADQADTTDVHAARLRAVHASPDAPAVDISPVDNSGAIVAPVLVEAISFGDADAAAGRSVPAATLAIGVAAAGSATPVATYDVTTSPGLRAFVVAAGSLGGGVGRAPFGLWAVDTSAAAWTVASIPLANH